MRSYCVARNRRPALSSRNFCPFFPEGPVMMKRLIVPLLGALVITVVACEQAAPPPPPGPPPPTPVERGKYLVNAGLCHDCHTPNKMGPNGPEPDMARMLSGHPENVKVETPP